ncbi:hypothetical protein, partial [Klebsiella pneumoniae]
AGSHASSVSARIPSLTSCNDTELTLRVSFRPQPEPTPRTTLHRLIKAGDLSTCSGERNAKMIDTSELLRVFGPFEQPRGEHHSGQVSEQRDTAFADQSEQVIHHLKQEIEHLNTLLLSKDSHIDSLKQAMLLLENHQAKLTESPAPWWKFWKKS